MSIVDAIKSISTEDCNQPVNNNHSAPHKHKKEGKGRKGRSKQNSLVLEDKGNAKKNDDEVTSEYQEKFNNNVSITIEDGNNTNTQSSTGNNEEKSNDKSNENENINNNNTNSDLNVKTSSSNLSNTSTPSTSAYSSPLTLSPSTSVQNFLNNSPVSETDTLTKTNSEGAIDLPKQVHSIKGLREKSNSLSMKNFLFFLFILFYFELLFLL
jgi:hypothetical protein